MPEKADCSWLTAPIRGFFHGFNVAFDWLSRGYGALTARLVRLVSLLLILYGGLIFLAYGMLVRTPTGLIPQLDRGYFIAAFQLPPGSTLDRTDAIMRKPARSCWRGRACATPLRSSASTAPRSPMHRTRA